MQRVHPLQSIFERAKHVVFSFAIVTILGCAVPTSGGERMQVEVDVFSGRPNPQWTLTPPEADQLIQRVQALPSESGEGDVKEGLGYRGLIVTKSGDRTENYTEISISNGLVIANKNGQLRRLVDQNRTLERWLFQTGKNRLENPLYQQIEQQIK
ncbi:hypothetical protein H6F43_08055 [Leptolyngbya sp. FACHB-36]|uniref:hypothetical protein n=1 Tax=Leptolyngbya sp. FACHB-36 TaxID=2692808 RepID=UPI0016802B7F|nr:hypothetical protein [Leptolyngbya sp. FACHB-36]MBD2020140.1 hypothetical protein [Leptolyngbya sp. FACHB-36]